MAKVIIRCDAQPVLDAIERLSAQAEASREAAEHVRSLLQSGEELVRVDGDYGSAPVAGEVLVRLVPSEALVTFVRDSIKAAADRGFPL